MWYFQKYEILVISVPKTVISVVVNHKTPRALLLVSLRNISSSYAKVNIRIKEL